MPESAAARGRVALSLYLDLCWGPSAVGLAASMGCPAVPNLVVCGASYPCFLASDRFRSIRHSLRRCTLQTTNVPVAVVMTDRPTNGGIRHSRRQVDRLRGLQRLSVSEPVSQSTSHNLLRPASFETPSRQWLPGMDKE